MNTSNIVIRKIIISSVLIILFILITFLIYNYGRLRLSLPDGVNSVLIVKQDTGEGVFFTESPTKSLNRILPRGKYEITISGDNKSTVEFISIGSFIFEKSIDVNLINQPERTKLGRVKEGCVIYSGGNLYSYWCSGSDDMYLNSPTSDSGFAKSEAIAIKNIIQAGEYKRGVLVLATKSINNNKYTPYLAYIEGSEIVNTYDLPSDFYSEVGNYGISIDNTSNSFAVYKDFASEVIFYKDINSKPDYLVPKIDTKLIEQLRVGYVDIIDSKLYVVFGKINIEDEPEDSDITQEQLSVEEDTQIITYSTENLQPSGRFTTKIGAEFINVCAGNIVCSYDGDRMGLNLLENNSLSTILTIKGVKNNEYLGNGIIYYSSDFGVYALDVIQKKSRLIYESNNFRPSSLAFSRQGLLVNSTNKNLLNTFLITDEISNDNKFIDDKLPYDQSVFNFILDSDYSPNGDYLVKLSLDSWESSGTGRQDFSYDENEFNRKKNEITNRFKNDFPKNNIFVIP